MPKIKSLLSFTTTFGLGMLVNKYLQKKDQKYILEHLKEDYPNLPIYNGREKD